MDNVDRREEQKYDANAYIFLKRGKSYHKNKKWLLSLHVESDSIWREDCHFSIGSTSPAGDHYQNGNHQGGRLSSCQKKSLIFVCGLSVCCSFESFENLGVRPEKK
jgi:hypothetical protein